MQISKIAGRAIKELEQITLGKPVETEDGTVPIGTRGTVVHAFDDGKAYLVEFDYPVAVVAIVERHAIAG